MSDEPSKIVALDRVPEDSTFLFTVREVREGANARDEGDRREAILLREDGDVVGWLNFCQHFTHIRLDEGSGATRRDGEVLCTNHGAMFDVDSGLCTHGLCEGAYLEGIEVSGEDGIIYLTDDRFEFVETGGFEGDEFDRTLTSNVDFEIYLGDNSVRPKTAAPFSVILSAHEMDRGGIRRPSCSTGTSYR